METRGRSAKRLRSTGGAEEEQQQRGGGEERVSGGSEHVGSEHVAPQLSSGVELSLQIKWISGFGEVRKTRINRLKLKQLESVEKLAGVSKGLMDKAFPEESRPRCLTDDTYCRWTPDETCLSLPPDVRKTEFKLVAMHNGWEFVILSQEIERERQDVEQADRRMFVAVIEFESLAVVLGNLGIRVLLVAYPVVCVQKMFLDEVVHRIETDPSYKGILT